MNFKYKIPCEKDKLSEIRLFINKVLRDYAIPDIETNMLILAVDEVCANLIIHSHECDKTKLIELSVEVDQTRGVTFEIVDHGKGFNILEYSEPSLEQVIEQRKRGGIGILLVKRIMDQIEFKSDKKHNVCKLFKKVNLAVAS